ncbi:hypothetical protein C1H46_011313 [Malus baccata]|uniref:Uncharacterized protein n=1 Tax=Malus baccata TaxID=106549 RepID=A0A540MWH3_MALBA|nr:hypothetical protein C1H46_011313 [Malus baccata]
MGRENSCRHAKEKEKKQHKKREETTLFCMKQIKTKINFDCWIYIMWLRSMDPQDPYGTDPKMISVQEK